MHKSHWLCLQRHCSHLLTWGLERKGFAHAFCVYTQILKKHSWTFGHFIFKKVKGQLVLHNIFWPLFNTVTQGSRSGDLQVLDFSHFIWYWIGDTNLWTLHIFCAAGLKILYRIWSNVILIGFADTELQVIVIAPYGESLQTLQVWTDMVETGDFFFFFFTIVNILQYKGIDCI